MHSARRSFFTGRAVVVLAAALACAANVVIGFPGIQNVDSKFQYGEAVSARYTDWHPPIMAHLWAALGFVAPGPAPLFVLHLLLYWMGFGLIATRLSLLGRRLAAWAVLVVAVLPTLLSIDVLLVKDVGMAASLLAAFAITFWYRAAQRRVPLPAALWAAALLLYGTMVRSNGIFAAAPLAMYSCAPALRLRPLRFVAACVALGVVTIPAANLVNHTLLDALPTHPIRSLQVFDVTGIAFFSKDLSVFGTQPGGAQPYTARDVNRCYSPRTWDALSPMAKCHVFWDALGTLPGLPDNHTPDGRFWYENPPNPALGRLWIAAIVKHPVAYLKHRLAHFNSALYFIVPGHHADRRVLDYIAYAETPPAPDPRRKLADVAVLNPLITPVVALVAGLVLLWRSWPDPHTVSLRREAIFFLAASGVAYAMGFLLVGVSSDLRYQLWTMTALFAAAAMALPDIGRRQTATYSRADLATAAILVITLALTCGARAVQVDALLVTTRMASQTPNGSH